jgi:hypothetical protein
LVLRKKDRHDPDEGEEGRDGRLDVLLVLW